VRDRRKRAIQMAMASLADEFFLGAEEFASFDRHALARYLADEGFDFDPKDRSASLPADLRTVPISSRSTETRSSCDGHRG